MAQAGQKRSLFGSRSKGKRFTFEGKSIEIGRLVRGEVVTKGEEGAHRKLQRGGIRPLCISKVKTARKRRITREDTTAFTRQLATMMRAGLPPTQVSEIVAHGHSSSSMTEMLMQICSDVGQGSALGRSLSKYLEYFDRFYCNLVSAGESGGVLESLLDKLTVYREKTQAIERKIKAALTYPIAIIMVVIALIFIMMMFILPAFREVYANMDTKLPGLTQFVMNLSSLFVDYGQIMVILLIASAFDLHKLHEKSPTFQKRIDALILRLPIFGTIVRKVIIARWACTTSALFVAGVPSVEVLDSVMGASGNILYEEATQDTRVKITQGLSLTSSIQNTDMFPSMVVQMAAIGEEPGSLDDMLNKTAESYEDEVDNSVSRLPTLIGPIIVVVLGSFIGILLTAMRLPLFSLGNVVG